MGMDTHIVGFVPPDEKWKKMKAVWDSCKAAKMDPPEEVLKFFNYDEPDDNGVEYPQEDLIASGAVTEWSAEMTEGFEVDVDKLPKDVKILRFHNSY